MKFRDLIKIVEEEGWYERRQKGSHKTFKHDTKRELITISGKMGEEVPVGILNKILKQVGRK